MLTAPPRNTMGLGHGGTLWNHPGLDRSTFYTAAMFLHAAAKGQLREPENHGRHHQSTADPRIQGFLDRLADCFARSKSLKKPKPTSRMTANQQEISSVLYQPGKISVSWSCGAAVLRSRDLAQLRCRPTCRDAEERSAQRTGRRGPCIRLLREAASQDLANPVTVLVWVSIALRNCDWGGVKRCWCGV